MNTPKKCKGCKKWVDYVDRVGKCYKCREKVLVSFEKRQKLYKKGKK